MDKDIKSIMKRFADERRKFGTQEKLAEIVGINAKTISAFENGRRTPSLSTFLKMCDAINADMAYVLQTKTEGVSEK